VLIHDHPYAVIVCLRGFHRILTQAKSRGDGHETESNVAREMAKTLAWMGVETRAHLHLLPSWPEGLGTDDKGNPLVWTNRYACECGHDWGMHWSSQCRDACDICGASVRPSISDWRGPDPFSALSWAWENLPAAETFPETLTHQEATA
jgi:hypothetical protein